MGRYLEAAGGADGLKGGGVGAAQSFPSVGGLGESLLTRPRMGCNSRPERRRALHLRAGVRFYNLYLWADAHFKRRWPTGNVRPFIAPKTKRRSSIDNGSDYSPLEKRIAQMRKNQGRRKSRPAIEIIDAVATRPPHSSTTTTPLPMNWAQFQTDLLLRRIWGSRPVCGGREIRHRINRRKTNP